MRVTTSPRPAFLKRIYQIETMNSAVIRKITSAVVDSIFGFLGDREKEDVTRSCCKADRGRRRLFLR